MTLGTAPTPDAVHSLDPRAADRLEIGRDLEVVAELPTSVGQEEVSFRGFSDDGLLVGAMSRPAPPSQSIPGPPSPYQSRPFLYDPETRDFTILDDSARAEPTGVDDIVATEDHAVWVESPDPLEAHDFTVRSYDRATKRVTDLASFTNPGGQIGYGRDLAVHDGVAYFSRHVYFGSKDRPAVYAVPVDGTGDVTTLVPGAEQVSLAGGVLSYTDGTTSMQRDLTTGTTRPAPTSPSAQDPGFCGAVVTEAFETDCLGHLALDPLADEDEIADPVLTVTSGGATVVTDGFPGESDN